MTALLNLFGAAQGWLALLGAGLLAALAAYLKGRSAGKASERAKQTEAALENRRQRDEVDDDIRGLDDSSARQRLRNWTSPDV